MGFLSGVLSNIQTHLGQHKGQITSAINSLNTNKHAGKNGFNDAIVKVVAGVRGYNDKVKRSNGNVRSITSKLLKYVTHGGDFNRDFYGIRVDDVTGSPEVKDAQVTKVAKLVKECRQNAREFGKNIRRADKDVADLNPQLRQNVERVKINIAHESKKLEDIHAKQQRGLDATEKIIKETLHGLNCNVNEKIKIDVEKLVADLKEKISGIVEELESINGSLVNNINRMQEWIDKAQLAVDAALEKVDFIFKELDENSLTRHPKQLKDAADSIKFAATVLFNNGVDARQQAEKLVSRAAAKLKLLEDAVRYDLFNVKQEIHTNVTTYISKYVEEVQKKVKEIKGNGKDNGLEGIKQKVMEYVTKYYEDSVESTVRELVQGIVDGKGVAFKDSVDMYVVRKKGRVDQQEVARVTAVIREYLPALIAVDIKLAAQRNLKGVTLGNLASKFALFAAEVKRELTKGSNSSMDEAAKAIEKAYQTSNTGITHILIDTNLKSAIKSIANSLISKIEKDAEEIELISKKAKVGNVQAALGVINTLEGGFPKALVKASEVSEYAEAIFYPGSGNVELHHNIQKTISQTLDKEIGEGDGQNKIKNFDKLSTSFKEGAMDRKSKKQDLEAEIQAMQHGITNALTGIETFNEQAVQKFNEVSHHLKALCKAVMGHAGNAKFHLETFKKHNIQGTLTDIRNKLDKLHGDVKAGPITKLKHLLNSYADRVRDKYVKQTQELVNEQVKRAVYTITQQARKQYVSFVSDMLTLFSTKVAEELTGLPQEMDHDLVIGFHGFMHRFEYTFNPNFSGYAANPPETLHDLSSKFSHSINYFVQELKTQTNLDADVARLSSPFSAVSRLFNDLNTSHHFDHRFSQNISDLISKLEHCAPKQFGDPSNAMLDVLKFGLHALAGELSKAYVSVYDGAHPIGQWVDEKRKLTTEGKHGAKVFLTILNTLCEDLPYLENKCKENSKYSWKHKTISEKHDNKENALGCYLKRCGYEVAKDEHSKDGELNFPDRNYMGGHIYLKLNETKYTTDEHTKHLKSCESNLDEEGNPKTENNFTLFNLLDCLLHHLEKYNEVCHFSTLYSKARPCSAYEMLVWLSGLPHNPVYHDLLHDGIGNVLEEPKNSVAVVDGIPLLGQESSSLAAYPNDITWNSMKNAVEHLCAQAYDVLIGILGTGNELTIYGSDFSNNSFKFHYPSSGEECLDMFLDILSRLFPPLKYLQTQCGIAANEFGWAGCRYGKDVHTTKSQCTDHSNAKAMCQPKCEPNSKANCQPNCQPTSPLMNYLTDSLLGHLPHRLVSVGCKSECKTCPTSKRGMPCLTPLGFREFSGSTRKGRDLCDLLSKLFNYTDLRSLFCLVTKPPATLPEHFTFALGFVQGWKDVKTTSKNLIKYAVESSIADRSIGLYKDTEKLTTALVNAYGNSQQRHAHKETQDPEPADVCSLAMTTLCAAEKQCAPYLSSLYSHAYPYFADKHSKNYLSWAVYLPWDFWTYLNELYNDFINILCQEWQCRSCLRGDKCKAGSHGMLNPKVPGDGCQCQSIVSCKGVGPTLYKYGFTYAEPSMLNEKRAPKTCFDFRNMLYSVLNSQYFKDLFKECDDFLWTIRTPFSYLVLALWLLSFLYLLHIMVIRLDLLHIKSHLHSPSSHRIAAQSLLAASRVNKLNRVFYLQP